MPIRAITLVLFLGIGCTSIHLTESSRKVGASGSQLTQILVAATAADANMGRALDSEVVARLADTGTRGFAAHESLPAGSAADRAALTALADRLGASAILDVRLTLATRTEPPSVKVTVVPAVTFWGSPRAAGRAPYASYTRTGGRPVEEARLEADLRTVNDPTPIWSASTEAFSQTDLPRATRDFADLVVRELRHQRLIAAYLRSPVTAVLFDGDAPWRTSACRRPRSAWNTGPCFLLSFLTPRGPIVTMPTGQGSTGIGARGRRRTTIAISNRAASWMAAAPGGTHEQLQGEGDSRWLSQCDCVSDR